MNGMHACASACSCRSQGPKFMRRNGADAARALVAVTNARIRGEDPTPRKLLSLIVNTLRPPSAHDSGIFWGVSRADGSGQLSENIKLAIFGAALQLTIEDLLSGASKVRLPAASPQLLPVGAQPCSMWQV